MSKREFERLGRKYLAPLLPGSKAAGEVVFDLQPEGWIRGFLFERTGHPGGRDFYLWAFIQPLVVPATSFVLSLGQRVGALWTLGDDDRGIGDVLATTRQEGVPFLARLRTNDGIANYLLDRLRREPLDLYAREAMAGLLVLDGKSGDALTLLDASPPSSGTEPAWARSDRERLHRLRDLIATNPADAAQHLRVVEREVLARLIPKANES